MKKHTVKTPERNYDVLIGYDLFPIVFEETKRISNKRMAMIVDANVFECGHLKRLGDKEGIPTFIVEYDENGGVESKKNVETYGYIIDFLDANKIEKTDTLICIGGGVIGDMGGFVAATYKRGKMTYIQVPTTTLSQRDSSVGGKCAIDSKVSKNAAGCIYQPHLVIHDMKSLESLDDRNYRAGFAEGVKHGIIKSEKHYNTIEKNINGILSKDMDLLEQLALTNVAIKGDVVKRDPNEKNERKCLNFGHTIGHAVEQVSGYKLLHGESIALGMLAALQISFRLRSFPRKEFVRIEELLLGKFGMPAKVPDYVDRDEVEKRLANDKKAVNGVPHFVTVKRIGELYVTLDGKYAEPIPKDILKEGMDYIFE